MLHNNVLCNLLRWA